MSFFKKIITNYGFWLILATTLYMLPMLIFPTFNYIDDGQTLLTGKTLFATNDVQIWKNNLFEYDYGRLRPGYQLYLILMYLLFDVRPFGYWLFQTIILALTLISLRALIKQLTQVKDWLISAVLIIFLLLPAVIQNAYRLGTAEPRQALFIILFLLWMAKLDFKKITFKNFVIGNGLLLLALTTKETSILLLPMILIFFGWARLKKLMKDKKSWWLFLTLVGQVVLFILSMPRRQGYTVNVDFSLNKLWLGALIARFDYAEYYFPMIVALILFFFRNLKKLKKGITNSFLHDLQWPLILLTGFTSSLFFVFSWEHQLERYHYLTFIFIILFLFYELSFYNFSFKNIKKLKQSFNLFSLVTVTFIILAGILMFQKRNLYQKNVLERTADSFQEMFFTHQAAGSLTNFLFYSLPEGTRVFVDSNDYEKLVDIGYFASRLGERQVLIYSINQEAALNYGPTHQYSTDIFGDYELADNPKLLIVADRHWFRFESDELELLAPSFIKKFPKQIYYFWKIKQDF